MTRSGVSRSTALVAGFVALLYASLAAVAVSCAFGHADPSNGHAHHGSHEAAPHNALCAWTCQAMSDAGPATESPALSTSPAVRSFVSSPDHEIPSLFSSPLRSRAPPTISFVLIG